MLLNIAAWSQGSEASDHVFKCGQTRFKLKGGSIHRHPAFEAIDALADHKATKQDIRAQLLLHALREVQGVFEEENCAGRRSDSTICSIASAVRCKALLARAWRRPFASSTRWP